MDNNSSDSRCDARMHPYKNDKTFEECKEEARQKTEILSKEILEKGEVSYARIMEMADFDELVYRLSLKYLRQKGYDIGYNKLPRAKA